MRKPASAAACGTVLIVLSVLLLFLLCTNQNARTGFVLRDVRPFSEVPKAVSAMVGEINVNTADSELLCTVPGIGPAKAKAIIAEREKSGPFLYDEDLLYVKGIGKKMLDTLSPYLNLGTAAKEGN